MARFLLAALMTVLLAAAGAAQAQTGAGSDVYRLAPGDRVSVSVLEDPNLGSVVLVRPDGRVSLPLAGTLEAAGRTPEELAAAIRRALSREFVQPPTVTVALVGVGEGNRELVAIYILGEVARPGRYDVELPLDALQALALSGGLGPFGAKDRIQIRRRTPGGETVFLLDYSLVEDGAVPTRPIALTDGDVIVVPQRGLFE